MPDTLTLLDTRYTLAEAAILSDPWPFAATSDVLAKSDIVISGVVAPQWPPPRTKVIRKGGSGMVLKIPAGVPIPQSFEKSVEGVVDLLGLQEGWNSYSAKPIGHGNAVRAVEVLFELLGSRTPPPIVVPTVRGGIQLEWHTKGVDIEVYIRSPTDVSFFAEHVESNESIDRPLANHEHELKSWLERISED